jgi:release factor family 3
MLNEETISRLLDGADPAISIYTSLEPDQRDLRAPDARLRELIGQADAMMERDGLDLRRREQLLGPVRDILGGTDFATHRDPALAIFSSDSFTIVETLPIQVAESVSVAADFHIKPLLPFLSQNRHFFILALSKTRVRLLAATPFSTQEVPLEYLPADAQAELDSQSESGALTGESVLEEERRALLTESPKRIAAAVKAALGNDVAPVVVVADPQVAGHFLKETDLPQLLEDVVTFNPFSVPDGELLAKALEVMQPILSEELATILDQLNARLGTAESSVAIRLEEILMGAQEGRVDVLVVAEDETIWGRFSPGTTLTAHGTRAPHDEDLLNQAVVLAMRNGARAFAVPRERLPRQVPAAALLRY